MRTTLDLDDELMRKVKQRAVETGSSATAVIEEALRQAFLPPSAPTEPFRLAWVTVHGRLLPGVDLADRDSLYERMEGRS